MSDTKLIVANRSNTMFLADPQLPYSHRYGTCCELQGAMIFYTPEEAKKAYREYQSRTRRRNRAPVRMALYALEFGKISEVADFTEEQWRAL